MKAVMIGTGKLGMPCAAAMAEYHDAIGFDHRRIDDAPIPMADTLEKAVEGRDLIFIAVETPHDPAYDGREPTCHLPPKDFDYSIVKGILTELNNYLTKDQMVVLISTVLPGTTRREFISLTKNYRFIYNPYLIAMGSVAWDMVNPEMVIIGTEDGSLTGDAEMLIDFYRPMMENDPRYEVGTWDEAECIKIFYNTYISAKIGLANMMLDVAEKNGNIDVDVVTNALAKSTFRITGPKYLKAGMGDAGGCHPRDNIALRYMGERLGLGYDLFDAIMSSREVQAKNLADYLVERSMEYNLPIYIHGKTYKPGVPYMDGSYSILVGSYIKEMLGYEPKYIDPNGYQDERDYIAIKGVILLAHCSMVTYDYSTETQGQDLYCEFLSGSVIVDPWRLFSALGRDNLIIYHYGNTRK